MTDELHHPAVGAALATAADLLGMEVVFVGGLTEDEFTFERVYGEWPGVVEGVQLPRQDSLCHRLLEGAAVCTTDAPADAHYGDAPATSAFHIRSYVGVPIHDPTGKIVGTLCGIDHASVPVSDTVIDILRTLAGVIEAHLGDDPSVRVVIRRTPQGWRVGAEATEDLLSAMVLADLLAEDFTPGRPPRGDEQASEVERLRLAVSQLEHALAARVVVEQAIGVLAERHHLGARPAFERLRRTARSRGQKVHDLARQVVASVTDPGAPLPPELAGRRPAH